MNKRETKLELENGREFCRDLFPGYEDDYLFSSQFVIDHKITDAWISPGGAIFPFTGGYLHISFEMEIGAKRSSPLWCNLEEMGWLRLSMRTFQFEHWRRDVMYPQYLSKAQKDVLIDLMEQPHLNLGDNDTLSAKSVLERDEEMRGRI